MAVSARELLLIVRAQNQASGALRRVGKDLASLPGGVRGAKMRAEQQRIVNDRLRGQQQLARNEYNSLTRGKQYMAMQKAMTSNAIALKNAELAREKVASRQNILTARQLENEAQRGSLSRRISYATKNAPNSGYLKDLQRQFTAASIRAKELQAEEGRLRTSMELATTSIEKQKMALQELGARQTAMAERAGYLQAKMRTQADALALGNAKYKEMLKTISDERWGRVTSIGSAIQHTGRVAQYAGLIVGGSLAVAAKSAADFSTQVTLAATQTGKLGSTAVQVAKNSKVIQAGILDLMKQFPASSKDMTAAAYDIYSSLSVTIPQGMKILKIANKAAVAGQTDLVTSTEGLITILNDYSKEGQNMPRLLNRMFAAVRFGRMTFAQFNATLSQTVPAMKSANQSFDTLSAMTAFESRHMPKMGMVSAGLARLSEMFSRKDFIAGLKSFGVTITDSSGHLNQMPKIIDQLIARFPKLREAAKTQRGDVFTANLFKEITAAGSKTGKGGTMGTIQGRRALENAILYQRSMHQIVKQVTTDNNEFNRSWDALSKTPGVTWATFVNKLKAFAIEIGTSVMPIIGRLGEGLVKLADKFDSLDKGTKDKWVRLAAYGAAFTLVGSAVLFLVGTFIKLFALMGKGFGAFNSILIILGLVTAAVELLHGNWHDLNDVIDTFVSFGTHGITGWVTMLGLAAVAALKLKGALMGVVATESAGGAAGAAGGLAGLLRGGRNLRAGVGLTRDAIKTEGLVKGIASSAALIPGSVYLAVGAIATAAAGALIWKVHMDGVNKTSKEIADATQRNAQYYARPGQEVDKFANLGSQIQDVILLRGQLRAMDQERKRAAAIAKKSPTATNMDALYAANINYARSMGDLREANAKANASFAAVSAAVVTYQGRLGNLTQQEHNLRALNKQLAEYQRMNLVSAQHGQTGVWDRQIKDTQRQINLLEKAMNSGEQDLAKAGANFYKNFNATIRTLSDSKIIPHVDADSLRMLQQVAIKAKRMLTQKEIKLLINAQLNPASVAKLPAAVRAAYQGVAAEQARQAAAMGKKFALDSGLIKPKANIGQQFLKAIGSPAIQIKTKVQTPNPKPARAAIASFFARPVTQRVHVQPPSQAILASIGQDISGGIQRNVKVITEHVKAFYDAYITEHRKVAQIKSPSRLMAREVGKPLVDGIIMGIVNSQNKLNKTAALSMQIMAGAYIQARQQAIDSYNSADAKAAQAKIAKDAATIDKLTVSLKKAKGAQVAYDKARIQSLKLDIDKQKLAAKKPGPITITDLIKDTQKQAASMKKFNNDLAILQKSGVPRQMLDDLRALGVDGLKNLTLLSNATPSELKKMVRAYNAAQKQIKASTVASVQDLKDWKQATADQLKQIKDDAANKLLDTWNGFKDQMTSAMGTVFSGPSGLSDKIDSAFKDAHDTWQSNVDDFKSQLGDLNQQIVDLNNQAAQQLADAISARKDELSSAFGDLFNGDWLKGTDVQNKIDWSIPLGFDDLQKDLQSQVDKFKHWRDDLTSLASKVPADLANQLEALGPDATDKLDILNNATDDQLAQYVKTWQQGQDAISSLANKTTVDTSDITSQIGDVLKQIDDVTAKLAALQEPKALTSQDLIDDLTGQKKAFADWQGTLDSLRKKNLPGELLQQLESLGPDAEPYLVALNNMTNTQLNGTGGFVDTWKSSQQAINTATDLMMNDQLKLWEAHGASIASAIIAGVQSEQSALLAYFRNLFSNLLTGNKTVLPTGTGSALNGAETIRDAQGGYNDTAAPMSYSAVSAGDNVTMNVTAVQDESLDAALNRARFALSNRKKP